MGSTRIAVVDMGSNTLKFSVTEVGPDGSRSVVDGHATTVRLGLGVAASHAIAPDRIDAALGALVDYERRAKELGATFFLGVATAAVRMAANRSELLGRIARETAWEVSVISGDEEAELTFLGLRSGLPPTGSQVIADIGGASTELIHVVDGAAVQSVSAGIGSGTLADRCFATDPPGIEAVWRARDEALPILSASLDRFAASGSLLVLSGGNGVFLSQAAVWEGVRIPFVVPFLPSLVEKLSTIEAVQVAAHLGIAPERARMLPAGGAIALALTGLLDPADLQAVQSGIRGGVIARWIERNVPGARDPA